MRIGTSQMEKELTVKAEREIENLVRKHLKTASIWTKMKDDPYLRGLWEMSDYVLRTKMHFNAHGDTHAKVVAANALKMLDILERKNFEIDTIHDDIGDLDDAFLIVLASALLHDIGNAIQREKHYNHSVTLAIPMLDKLLPEIYKDPLKLAQIRGSILHSIGTHMEDVQSYTLEASLLKIADGTDITKGRSRLDYDPESINIHTVSASSIGDVAVTEGHNRPIDIIVKMTNSAGVFQVQEVLYKKMQTGIASPYVEIEAITIPEGETDGKKDERIVHKVLVLGDKFIHISPLQRYLGNLRTKEIHDLSKTIKTCGVDKIKDKNKVFFESMEEVEKAVDQLGYNGCKRCFHELIIKSISKS